VTEVQRYQVLKQYRGFEVRTYPAHSLVTMDMTGDLARAGNSAFGYLASYIGGANTDRRSISMTAPVIERPIYPELQSLTPATARQSASPAGYRVSFVMPAEMGDTQPPTPTSGQLKTERNPGGIFAARRFSGVANQQHFFDQAEKLTRDVELEGLKVKGSPVFARYNGPWTPGPLRRNEVLLELEAAPAQP
jgi:hypothetical protein